MKGELINLVKKVLKDKKSAKKISENANQLAPNILRDFEKRAEAEKKAGAKVEIDYKLPTLSITMSDGSDFFFQEREASDMLDQVPENINAEDYFLAIAQGW